MENAEVGISINARYRVILNLSEPRLRLRSGKTIQSHNVVMALGLANVENRPSWILNASKKMGVHHSADVRDHDWREKRLLVVGAGQSAAEIAIKAIQRGAASVDMVFRADNLIFNSMHSEFTEERKRRLFRIKHAFSYSSPEFRLANMSGILPVSIEPHLKSELNAKVNLRAGCQVEQLHGNADGAIRVDFHDGSQNIYDHVVCATGYKPAMSRLPLKLETLEQLKLLGTLPDLNECAESSSCSGLFFLGSWAMSRFGPQSNFIFGSHQIIPRVIGLLARLDT